MFGEAFELAMQSDDVQAMREPVGVLKMVDGQKSVVTGFESDFLSLQDSG
jgi:hypothetical protein